MNPEGPAPHRPQEEEVEEDLDADVLSDEGLRRRIKLDSLTDVGVGGVSAVWSVSSAKHGNGVDNVMDYKNLNTFWQSDGVLPHTITLQFKRLTTVASVCVYFNFERDESYTPRVVRLSAGTHDGDMTEIALVAKDAVTGWVIMDVGDVATPPPEVTVAPASAVVNSGSDVPSSAAAASATAVLMQCAAQETAAADELVWCTKLSLEFMENYQNGRDCHVRGVRVLGPRSVPAFTDPLFTQHLMLR